MKTPDETKNTEPRDIYGKPLTPEAIAELSNGKGDDEE